MRGLFLLGVFFCSLVFATQDIKELREQVIGYNQGLIQAARTSKVDHLRLFLTEPLIEKTLLWIKAYHDDNLFMDAIVNKIAFDTITPNIEEKSAQVITQEEWRYRYINIKSKKEVYPPTKIFYKMKYLFIYLNERWIIKEVTVLSERQEKL